jgi:hypothetical protein
LCVRGEGTEVGAEVPDELREALIALRAEELDAQRIRQDGQGGTAGDEQTAQETTGLAGVGPAPGDRHDRAEDAQPDRGHEEDLEVDERLPDQQSGQDQPVAQRATGTQREDPPDDQRDQELRDDVGVPTGVRDHAGREGAEERSDPGGQPRRHELPGQHQVPRDAGDCQRKREKYVERHMRAEQQSDRRQRQGNGQHRGVGHDVDAIGIIHAIGEERIDAIREHPRTVRHHPLEEDLILRIVPQFMIKIEPQRRCDEERNGDETRHRENVSQYGDRPPAAPGHGGGGCRLPNRPSSRYDQDRRGDNLLLEGDELRVQVVCVGPWFGRQDVPTSRLACRVNTCNRHSIGEPIRGW